MSDEEKQEGVTTEEAEASRAEQSSGWDKDRQWRDELNAAARREGELQAKLDAALESMEAQKVADDQAKAAGEEYDLDEYDNLVRYTKELRSELVSLKDQNAELKQTVETQHSHVEEIRQQTQAEKAQAEGMKILNAKCDELDKRFSPSHRQKALQELEKDYAEFGIASVPPVARERWIMDTLELKYRKLAETNPGSTNTTSSTTRESGAVLDTGTGGGSSPDDTLPEGTVEEVAAAMNERDRRLAGG